MFTPMPMAACGMYFLTADGYHVAHVWSFIIPAGCKAAGGFLIGKIDDEGAARRWDLKGRDLDGDYRSHKYDLCMPIDNEHVRYWN